MKPFLASPNETIEAAFQKLKLKIASVKKTQTVQNEKKCRGAKKKIPMSVPSNPFADARITEPCV